MNAVRKPKVESCPECGAWLDVRSLPQNSSLHAELTGIARTMLWAGQKLSVDEWKRLFVAAYCREKKQSAKILPTLDGQGFDVIYKRTSRMGKKELSELLEFIYAWRADHE